MNASINQSIKESISIRITVMYQTKSDNSFENFRLHSEWHSKLNSQLQYGKTHITSNIMKLLGTRFKMPIKRNELTMTYLSYCKRSERRDHPTHSLTPVGRPLPPTYGVVKTYRGGISDKGDIPHRTLYTHPNIYPISSGIPPLKGK